MEFNDTVFTYPIKSNGEYWYRYRGDNNPIGYTNYQLYFDNIKNISLSGKLTFDGEKRLGNTFNKSGEGSVYKGEGLSSCFKINGTLVNKLQDVINYNKIQGSQWLNNNDGFIITNSTTAYTSCKFQFNLNPFYAYNLRFDLDLVAGDIYYNSKGSITNNKKVSGTYSYMFYASSAGVNILQDFYFFAGALGTTATIKNIVIEKIHPLFLEECKVKTSGEFIIKDHGFSPISIQAGETPSYSKIELNDWTWDETPIGGHSIAGMFGEITLKNYRLTDNYAKTCNEVDFLEEGARGFSLMGANSGNPKTMPKRVIIENFYCEKSLIPGVSAIMDVTYRNIIIDGFGTYYNENNELKDLGTLNSRPLYSHGGQAFKTDTVLYSPLSRMLIDNVVFKNTSKLMSASNRVWQSFWSQTTFKNTEIKNCRFDSRVLMNGENNKGQSWSFRHTLNNCEITEDGFLNIGYGSRVLNCKFTRVAPTKNSDGTLNANSNVDYPFPVYTDTKLAAFTNGSPIDTVYYGKGDSFDYTLFDNCLFVARYFYPIITYAKLKFTNCLFENGTIIYAGANATNYDFNLRFVECKRILINWYSGTIDLTRKSTSIVELIDTEVIFKGYTGIADLNNPSSIIRLLFDNTTYVWNNLKIYSESGVLLHSLKGFEWLREPNGVYDIGVEGSYYETDTTRYDYKNGKWRIRNL
jgi:hypothetical protein